MTSRERVVELRRTFEDSACGHADFMCLTCCDAAISRAIDEAVAEAVKAEREACVKIVDGFASGHHFAGDLTGEKSFRRCMDAIRGRGAK